MVVALEVRVGDGVQLYRVHSQSKLALLLLLTMGVNTVRTRFAAEGESVSAFRGCLGAILVVVNSRFSGQSDDV